MRDYTDTYKKRTPKSGALHQRALAILPGGINHNIRFYPPYPIYVQRAQGPRIWDVDGNEYIDLWMVHLSAILGHAHPAVIEALEEQAPNALHYGLVHERMLDLGELVCEMVPCAEMVRFCGSGTEATHYAARLARAYTGKRVIAKVEGGWHGGNDVLQVAWTYPYDRPLSGVIPDAQRYTVVIPFNDLEGTESVLAKHQEDLAAVIIEPVLGAGGCIPADREYLLRLGEITERYGSLLIFDEVITGFRFPHCAQGLYDIKPDLTTLGKTLGGGLPIGAICGRGEIMELATPSKGTFIGGGTFSGNVSTMTTGIATLTYLKEHPSLYERIALAGDTLRRGIDGVFTDHGIRAQTTGTGSMLATHFPLEDIEVKSNRDAAERCDPAKTSEYNIRLINHGVFFIPGHGGAISGVHGEREMQQILHAAEIVATEMSEG